MRMLATRPGVPRFCSHTATSADPHTPGTRTCHSVCAVAHLMHHEPEGQPRPQPCVHIHKPTVNTRCTPATHQNSAQLSQRCRSTKAPGEQICHLLGLESNLSPACEVAGPLGMDSGISPASAQKPCTNIYAPLEPAKKTAVSELHRENTCQQWC